MTWKPQIFLLILSVLPNYLSSQLDVLNDSSFLTLSNCDETTLSPEPGLNDTIILKSKDGNLVKLREKYALFFAINEYQDTTWEDLKNPIQEVDSIARILKDYYGFDTTIYRNVTKAEIELTLGQWQNKTFGDGAQLFVYFSGHGTFNNKYKQGYFVPVDGNSNNHYLNIELGGLGNMVTEIPCKHILLAIDACYSGTILPLVAFKGAHRDGHTIHDRMDFIRRQLAFKSRIVITSGGKEQTPDKSKFAAAILSGLKWAYTDGDGVFAYADLVARLVRVKPTPYKGELIGHQGGSFVFVVKPIVFNRRSRDTGELDEVITKTEIERGIELFKTENYQESFALLYKYRNSIHLSTEGLNRLGVMYVLGKGVDKNESEAFKCFKKSAELGDPQGQYNLGLLYQQMEDERNLTLAFFWFEKSAEEGNVMGQLKLGTMYLQGYGVERDYDKARRWFRHSAAQGNASGQYNLAMIYENGYGVEKDKELAIYWYETAWKNGSKTAQEALKRLKK